MTYSAIHQGVATTTPTTSLLRLDGAGGGIVGSGGGSAGRMKGTKLFSKSMKGLKAVGKAQKAERRMTSEQGKEAKYGY